MNPMSLRFQGLVAVLLATVVTLVQADPLPRATPESVGLSGPRLERIGAMLHQWVDKKEIPGAVIMIARHGKLAYVETVGVRDAGKGAPLAEDSLFRLYSMTKPIVSIAAMSLVEEGRLAVNEPISKYLPEFKDMKVATEVFDPVTGTQIYTTAPAKRPITVQDLLRHTSGLTYGAPLNERTQVQRLYRDAGIWSQKWVLADFTKALAQLPLMYEPGTTWEYGHSTDVLGRVVEVAAGKTLDAVLAERIFQPLGMRDTAFNLPEGGVDRLAQPQPDPYTGKTPDLLDFTQHQTFFAGGHGLVGTAADYLRFVEMLVEGGTLEGTRVLGPRIVDYVASNHLHGGIALTPSYLPGPGYGFGLGFGVRLERGQSPQPGSVGDYYWGGYGGTAFWIDPKEKMVVVFMTTEPTRRNHYRAIVRDLIYAAILD